MTIDWTVEKLVKEEEIEGESEEEMVKEEKEGMEELVELVEKEIQIVEEDEEREWRRLLIRSDTCRTVWLSPVCQPQALVYQPEASSSEMRRVGIIYLSMPWISCGYRVQPDWFGEPIVADVED
ncbi:hypothetical protein QYM36_003879 [Artemia franciscana]|uniref:Uncharacterized protein n=1 Tax=Artemia franciscana TaxID=6661 RepID=A0AA88ICK3_ARTSF|nr:hypothetical protein QYM36_003879 [Artemia franciscana]